MLNYVTITGKLGSAAAGAQGVWTPTNWLMDAADGLVIPPAPVPFTVSAAGTFATAPLVANDNPAPQPQGTGWKLIITGIEGVAPYENTYVINYSGGATQDLSQLTVAEPSPEYAGYLQLPPGNPAAGDAPVATGTGTVTQWAGVALLAGATFQGYVAPAAVTLADGPVITLNAAAGNHFRVTLGGSRALATPANPTDAQKIVVEVIQDSAGSRTLSYSGSFSFGLSPPAPVLSTAPGKRDFLGFSYDALTSLWYLLAFASDY